MRASQPPVTERRVVSLRPGGSTVIGADLLAGRIADTAKVTLGVSRSAGFDVPSLLLALDRYPLGCAEQTVSRALPLLYLSEVARQSGMADDAGDPDPRPGRDRAGALLSSGQRQLRPVEPGIGRSLARFLCHGFSDAGARGELSRSRSGVLAGARQSGELAVLRRQCRRSGAANGLCHLCAGAQSAGIDRRSSLFRRRQARNLSER